MFSSLRASMTPASSGQDAGAMRRVIGSCMVGNALEWYDFVIYGYFSEVIGHLFFPQSDSIARLMMTWGVFAVGFLVRPLGGIVFGYLGDKTSRKLALLVSIYVMSIPTAVMGCLPVYADWGLWAPALLMVLRVLQGLAIGGEFPGSMVFMVEHADDHRRGISGSWAMFSVSIGVVVGSLVATATFSCLEQDALYSWGWRLPFIFSLVGGGVGSWMRRHISDPETYLEYKKKRKGPHLPLRSLWRHHKQKVGVVLLLDFLTAVGFGLVVIFFPVYLKTFHDLPSAPVQVIHTINMVVFGVMTLVGGGLSDMVGRCRMVRTVALFFVVAAYPLWAFCQPHSLWAAACVQAVLASALGLFMGVIPSALAEIFPTSVRFLGVSLGHSLSMALFCGTAPMMATFLIEHMGTTAAPALGMMVGATLSWCSVFFMKERAGKHLLA